MYLSRRHFFNLLTAGFVLPIINGCKKSEETPREIPVYDDSNDIFQYQFNNKINISNDDIILFQGDSITECHRNSSILGANDNSGLGDGYAAIIADNFLQNHTSESVYFFNRGVSGNAVTDLSNRWTTDCINLKPSIINILIGVNDLRSNSSPNSYYSNYLSLLQNTKNSLPDAKLIICEPFLLPNYPNYKSSRSTLQEYRKIVRLLARDFNAVFIPYYDLLLNDEKSQSSDDVISTDGFHPTLFGHSLMADAWFSYLL